MFRAEAEALMELSGRLIGAAAMIEVGAAKAEDVPELMRRVAAEIEATVKGEPLR